MKCSTCKEEKTNPLDIEAIEKIGECLFCDHLRSDSVDTGEQNEMFYEGHLVESCYECKMD